VATADGQSPAPRGAGAGPFRLNTRTLLRRLFEMIDKGTALGSQFTTLTSTLKVPEGAPRILFMTGVTRLLRDMPDRFFAEPKIRLALVDAAQDYLDELIEAEELGAAAGEP
jgi:type III secretion system TyeA family effector delivery regulator